MHDYMKTIISAIKSWTIGKIRDNVSDIKSWTIGQIRDNVSDWNQNDETALNYVKNRPFYSEVKISEKYTLLEWDGDYSNKPIYRIGMADGLCWVSDKIIPDYTELIGKTVSYYANGELNQVVLAEEHYNSELGSDFVNTYGWQGYSFYGDYTIDPNDCTWQVYIITESTDDSYPAGIYFTWDDNYEQTYVTSIELNEVITTKKETIKTIDSKYLPIEYDRIILYDKVTNCKYAIEMINGTLVSSIDIDKTLIDFEYTDNQDGTYTITAWKGTLNGKPSTEMIVPNNSQIII